jgi:hypothetical protein
MKELQPLIDGDILRYEIGYCGELKNEEGGIDILPFDTLLDILNQRMDVIADEIESKKSPIIFLTGDKYLHEKHTGLEYVPNFRDGS